MPTLKVFPNPYKQLDHQGRPCSVLPYEPEGDGVTTFDARRFVGARLQVTILKTFAPGDARQMVQDNSFVFEDEAVDVPDTAYYRTAIRQGDLIAADKVTARKAGVVFTEPKDVLERSQREAGEHWKNVHKHEDHDYEGEPPKALTELAFGPMSATLESRKKRLEDAKKAEAEELKKAEATKKAEEERKKAEEASKKGGK